ncbi:MAG: HD domain-containing protein [Candidatus Omnitrophica bacterium]|nr:HD domain-containing protein [Candidatus Omnitrophota bacterium]
MSTKNSSTLTKRYRLILSAGHMIYRLVNSTYNVEELALRLTRLLCQFIKAGSANIYLLDRSRKKIVLIAIFNNKINILLNKKKDLINIPEKEKKVARGYAVIERHFIGLPLIADENVGAVVVRREKNEPPFSEFDKEMLAIVAEQSVTAIKNIQLYQEQQKIILESIRFIGMLLKRQGHAAVTSHTPVYFKIVKTLAETLAVSQEEIDNLYYASVLRDAGAIDVPYNILAKTSQLTPEEFKVIREHPAQSVELIRPVDFLRPVLPIILYRREHYDGTGYPSGLRREQIPIGARVMAIIDAFEAMTRERPYKTRLSVEEAIRELRANSGTQFDPRVIDAFIVCTHQKKFRNYLSSAKG